VDFDESPFFMAARAYRRECGWDFTPAKAGIWVFAVAPYTWLGSDEDGTATGRLVGFLILHDRDEDGTYESLAHIWTASAWRRRGIARKMLAEARRRGYWPSSALTAGSARSPASG